MENLHFLYVKSKVQQRTKAPTGDRAREETIMPPGAPHGTPIIASLMFCSTYLEGKSDRALATSSR